MKGRHTFLFLAAAAAAALAAAPSGAEPSKVGQLTSEIAAIESEVGSLKATYLKDEDDIKSATHVEKRVTDGELYFRLGDYQRSAIIFLDIVDNYEKHPAFPNALFMLAESMFFSKDYYGARTRYIEVLDRQGSPGFGPYITPALSRLLEISMHLQQFEGAEKYFGQLDAMSGGSLESITRYVKGKYYYFKGDLDKALQTFQAIKPSEEYYAQAQFFVGVVDTARQDLQGAIAVFEPLTKIAAGTPRERKLVALATLNLGRVYYESGQMERSAAAYESIPPTSELYDQALYEIAWTYIKMNDFVKAERSLEVLSISNPESKLIPEAKILRGNLLVREGKYDDAMALFKEIGKQFEPVKKQLDEVMQSHPDPAEYFHALVKTNLETFDAASFLPPLALAWIKQDALTESGIQVLDELALCGDAMGDNTKLVEKMKFVLQGDGKVNAFSLLKAGRARSIQIANRLTQLMKKALAYEESLLPDAGKGQLAALQEKRKKYDAAIGDLPVSPEEFAAREGKAKENYKKLGQVLAVSEARADRLHAKIVATKLYIEGVIKEKTGVIPADVKALGAELDAQLAAVEAYRADVEEIGKMLQLAVSSVGVGDENDKKDAALVASYQSIMKEEWALLKSFGVSDAAVGQLDALFERMEKARGELDLFNASVETLALKKSKEVLALIEKEEAELADEQAELDALGAEAGDAVSALTLDNFTAVKKSFDDLIIKADVGVIDVTWALKEEHKNRVQYLTSERLEKIQFLDDEFSEILEDPDEAAKEGEEKK